MSSTFFATYTHVCTSLSATKNSPLTQAGIATEGYEPNGLRIRELNVALVRLRSLASPIQLQKSLEECGIDLPMNGNESLGQDSQVLCLRSGKWLLISELIRSGALTHRLKPAVEGEQPPSGHVVQTVLLDVSDGYAVFQLSGSAAPWLLSKISCVDFLAAAGSGQHAVRTRLGQNPAVVSYYPVSPVSPASPEFVFDLLFDRSMTAYLWQLLLASVPHAQELAAEFGRDQQLNYREN